MLDKILQDFQFTPLDASVRVSYHERKAAIFCGCVSILTRFFILSSFRNNSKFIFQFSPLKCSGDGSKVLCPYLVFVLVISGR